MTLSDIPPVLHVPRAFPGTTSFPNATGLPQTVHHMGLSAKVFVAAMLMQGMLAHSTRYKPREAPDIPKDWHEAMAQEAFELTEALFARQRLVEPES